MFKPEIIGVVSCSVCSACGVCGVCPLPIIPSAAVGVCLDCLTHLI